MLCQQNVSKFSWVKVDPFPYASAGNLLIIHHSIIVTFLMLIIITLLKYTIPEDTPLEISEDPLVLYNFSFK